jgi:hypothetical protein
MSFNQSNIVLTAHGTTIDEIQNNLINQLKTCAAFCKNINIQTLIVDPCCIVTSINIDLEHIKNKIGVTKLTLEKIEYR